MLVRYTEAILHRLDAFGKTKNLIIRITNLIKILDNLWNVLRCLEITISFLMSGFSK